MFKKILAMVVMTSLVLNMGVVSAFASAESMKSAALDDVLTCKIIELNGFNVEEAATAKESIKRKLASISTAEKQKALSRINAYTSEDKKKLKTERNAVQSQYATTVSARSSGYISITSFPVNGLHYMMMADAQGVNTINLIVGTGGGSFAIGNSVATAAKVYRLTLLGSAWATTFGAIIVMEIGAMNWQINAGYSYATIFF